jgi:hypothetical protein
MASAFLPCRAPQKRNKNHVRQTHKQRRDQAPCHRRVPDRRPQKSRSAPEARVHRCQNLRYRKGQMRRSKQFFTRTEKWDEQRDLQRVHKIIHDLNRRQIQPPKEGHERAKRRSCSQHGKHSQGHAERQAQSHLFRRHALAQQFGDRPSNSPSKEASFPASIHLHEKRPRPHHIRKDCFLCRLRFRVRIPDGGLRSFGERPMLRVSKKGAR